MGRNRKTFKEFYKDYGAFLLKISHSRLTVGDLADIENRFYLEIENKSIIDVLVNTPVVRKKYRDFLENLPLNYANLPSINFENEFFLNINLPIPNTAINIDADLKRDKIISCQFDNVWVKVLENSNDNEIKLELKEIFKNLKNKDRRNLRKDIGSFRKAYLVEELYYAKNVSLNITKGFGFNADVESKIKGIGGIKLTTGVDNNSNHSYLFECNELTVPFAAKVISLKEL